MNTEDCRPLPRCDDSRTEGSGVESREAYVGRILIADDDYAIRHLIAKLLIGRGFTVTTVNDGEQAWEALCDGPFDVLLTDNQMPELSGVELIERIRAAGLRLPVIMVSGAFALEEMCSYPGLHIHQVLPKPFNPSELVKAVQIALFTGGGSAAGAVACGQVVQRYSSMVSAQNKTT
jgi:DNA-binding response OmpR family regulator